MELVNRGVRRVSGGVSPRLILPSCAWSVKILWGKNSVGKQMHGTKMHGYFLKISVHLFAWSARSLWGRKSIGKMKNRGEAIGAMKQWIKSLPNRPPIAPPLCFAHIPPARPNADLRKAGAISPRLKTTGIWSTVCDKRKCWFVFYWVISQTKTMEDMC